MTIENSTSVGSNNFNAFVDINDTLYVTDQSKKILRIMPTKTGLQTKGITTNLTFSMGLFVTNTGDIYLDQGNNSHIIQCSANTAFNKIIMYINRGCNSLFVSIDNILYCSINDGHQVIKMPLNSNVSLLTTAAGTGCSGSTSNMLDQPSGIYVDDNFNLYVADTGNDRIQLFPYGELNANTLAGKNATIIPPLDRPTSVILDADGYLFIVDSGNQRIIRFGSGVFNCIIGCQMQSCVQPYQLCNPLTAIFDSLGNIYVTNQNKSGIQKYILATNSCGKFSTEISSFIFLFFRIF
jgi:sugar lactone lactonase YvrE